MVASTVLESGVLAYQRFLSEDNRKIVVSERYASSDAAIAHLQAFREKFGTEFSRLVTRDRFLIFGTPSAELKALLSGYGATFFSRMDGFSSLRGKSDASY